MANMCMNTMRIVFSDVEENTNSIYWEKFAAVFANFDKLNMSNLIACYDRDVHPMDIEFDNVTFDRENNTAHFTFDTRWTPPEDWYEILLEEYGESCIVDACFYEPGEGFFGVYDSELARYAAYTSMEDFRDTYMTRDEAAIPLSHLVEDYEFPEEWMESILEILYDNDA